MTGAVSRTPGAPRAAALQAVGAGLAAAWSAQVRTDDAALEEIAAEWEDLYARCPAATPFQTSAWVTSWWREYGGAGRLRLVLVRRDGVLVAAAALLLIRRGPVRVLAPVGGDQSDYHDVLADPSVPGATERLAAELLRLPGWDVLDVRDVRAGAAAYRLAESWSGRRWRTRCATCLELPVGSVQEFVDRLPSGRPRQEVRRKLRKAQAGADLEVVEPGDVPAAVDEMLDLHARQWERRGVTAEHLRPRFRRHLGSALSAMAARGQAEVARFRVDGEVVLVDVAVVGTDAIGTYLAGFRPELRQRFDVATVMLRRVLLLAERCDLPRVSLLRGDEPYKAAWRPEAARNARLLLARRRLAPVAAGYAALVAGRVAAADALRERAPRLRDARRQARSAVGRLRRAR